MLTVAEAEAKILHLTQSLDATHDRTFVTLDQACGRILAEAIGGPGHRDGNSRRSLSHGAYSARTSCAHLHRVDAT
jgi:hypothetical protein